MFKIYEFRYRDRNSGVGFVFYARREVFADRLASRITALGIYSLQRRKIGYKKEYYTEIPPYELELEQDEYVEGMEKKSGEKRKDTKQRDLKKTSANIL